ncbi:hypothetical protein DL764_001616 [Monosporascus ibericus]|uniref:Uncharacterized protein n=1 Tax=Monosporascus ibericus TaxID=155417 RepID=A0A4Q4TNS1_9PEZI|nr:hypothetical protein DL764_001616 [Monosporascus ibericus]
MPQSSVPPPLLLDKFRQKYSWANGATRGTESSREQYHKDLKNAFAEIDGLMAGFKYLDEMGPRPRTEESSPPSPPDDAPAPAAEAHLQRNSQEYPREIDGLDAPHDRRQVIDEGRQRPVSEVRPDRQPMAAQWTAIRNLREETEYHHRRFQTMPSLSDDPIIAQLRRDFRDAKSIRKTGIIIFRDVLDDYRPTKLKEIFAFASLSYAVSQVLFKTGRIDKFQILSGVKTWRDSISDDREKEAFNKLAYDLWPEAKDHLHFIPMQRTNPEDRISLPKEVNYGNPTTIFMDQGSNTTFDDHWPGQDISPEEIDAIISSSGFSDHIMGLTECTYQAFGFSRLQDIDTGRGCQPPATYAETSLPTTSAGYSNSGCLDPHPPMTNLPPVVQSPLESAQVQPDSEVAQLRGACVFLVILAFISENQELLHILSGRGLIAKPDKLYKAEREDQKMFYKSAQEQFFEPRRRSNPQPNRAFPALLSTAKIFTKEAYLRTIPEVKHYLLTVAVS